MSFQSGVVVRQEGERHTLRRINIRSVFVSTDALVVSTILLLGLSAFIFHQRSSEFLGDDVFFADCARSLMQHGNYGINGHLETNQPPGLSLILASLFAVFGYGYAVCLRAMAVFETLGFLASYVLLRRHLPKQIAAAICVLLSSSPIYFQAATESVFPCFPLFFTTTVALLAYEEYHKVSSRRYKLISGVILTLAVAASLILASAAIGFLAAMIAVSGVAFVKNKRSGLSLGLGLLPALLIGILIQGFWMHRKPDPLEWPLPGYPAPYLQQLKVKSGNYPELGMATLWDLPVRVSNNALAQSDLLIGLVARHGVKESKVEIVIVPVLLVVAGWVYSIWQSGGDSFLGWYFAAYEFIYLLWPWGVEQRFFLPIAPLACLYAWKGLEGVYSLARVRLRTAGLVWLPFSVVLAASSYRWLDINWARSALERLPEEIALLIWITSALCAARVAYTNQLPSFLLSSSDADTSERDAVLVWPAKVRAMPYAFVVIVAIFVAIGVLMQSRIAHKNTELPDLLATTDTSLNPMALEVESGLWIRSHTPAETVVMARHLPTVYHYSHRRLIWFPPSSNADMLMQGILRHKVDIIVVIKHRHPYYLPDDDYCFDRLMAKYGNVFKVVFQDSDLRIVSVLTKPEHQL